MDSNRNKIIRVSDLIGRHEELLRSNNEFNGIRCYYRDHEHDEDEGSMVTVEDSSVFRLGEQFCSYNDLLHRMDEHSKKSYVHYWRRDSRTVDGAHMKTSRPIAPSLKYYSVKFACIFGGQKFMSRGKGKRPSNSRRTNCSSHITVRANKCGKSLEVISVCNHHNHPVSRELYHRMPHDRRLPPNVKEDVLDLLRLGFNQKRVRDYIEWETGKKLSYKDVHNLMAIDKRPKVVIAENRALRLEQILADFEANEVIKKVNKKRKRKEQPMSETETVENDISAVEVDDIPNDDPEQFRFIKKEEMFAVGNEIEISLEEGISCVPTIDGNFLTYLDNRNHNSPGSDVTTLTMVNEGCNQRMELLADKNTQMQETELDEFEQSFSPLLNDKQTEIHDSTDNNVYLEGDIPNDDVFIFQERGNDAEKITNLHLVSYENDEVLVNEDGDDNGSLTDSSENNDEYPKIDEIQEVKVETETVNEIADGSAVKSDFRDPRIEECGNREFDGQEQGNEVVYFSDGEVARNEEKLNSNTHCDGDDAEGTCCETCGRLRSNVQDHIDRLRMERDELLKETATLKRQKSKLLGEILCLKSDSGIVENSERNASLDEMTDDDIWIVIG